MTTNWAAVKASIDAALADLGQGITIRRQLTAGTVNPSTCAITDTIVRAVDCGRVDRIAGGAAIRTDRRVFYASASFEPRPGDFILNGLGEMAILEVEATSPGGTAVVYRIEVAA